MNNSVVSYEIALIAKAKNFDKPSHYLYNDGMLEMMPEEYCNCDLSSALKISAPMKEDLLKWLRDKSIDVTVVCDWTDTGREYNAAVSYINDDDKVDIYIDTTDGKTDYRLVTKYATYEEAFYRALSYALNLVETPDVVESVKILFLDFDGVLNIDQDWTMDQDYHKNRDEYGDPFSPDPVKQLARIIEKTGAKIVISSTWRYSGADELNRMWEHRGLPSVITGITPHIGNSIRGKEVEKYLHDAGFFPHLMYSTSWYERQKQQGFIKTYCIIDDDSDFMIYQQPHFVHCGSYLGLTESLADRAIKILNSPPVDPKK